MLRQSPAGWPTHYVDPWHMPQPPGGVAPLRQDIALAWYLEKRRAYGTSPVCRFNIRAAVATRRIIVRRVRVAGLRDLPEVS